MCSVSVILQLVFDIIYSEVSMKEPIPQPLTGATASKAFECSGVSAEFCYCCGWRSRPTHDVYRPRGEESAQHQPQELWSSPWCWNEAISLQCSSQWANEELCFLLFFGFLSQSLTCNRVLELFMCKHMQKFEATNIVNGTICDIQLVRLQENHFMMDRTSGVMALQ